MKIASSLPSVNSFCGRARDRIALTNEPSACPQPIDFGNTDGGFGGVIWADLAAEAGYDTG